MFCEMILLGKYWSGDLVENDLKPKMTTTHFSSTCGPIYPEHQC